MIELSEHDKRVLASVGHGAYGRELVQIVQKAKGQIASLDGLERGKDHNAEVEGRLLFTDFANELIRHLTFEKRPKKNLEKDDYE